MSDGVYEKKTYAWRLPNGGVDYASALQETITMRDQFAMAALTGLLANPKLQDAILKKGGANSGWIEQSAYAFADAMMKTREAPSAL